MHRGFNVSRIHASVNATDLFSQDVGVEEAGQVRSDRLGVERLELGEAERQPLALGRRQPLGEGLLKSHMSHSVKVLKAKKSNTVTGRGRPCIHSINHSPRSECPSPSYELTDGKNRSGLSEDPRAPSLPPFLPPLRPAGRRPACG